MKTELSAFERRMEILSVLMNHSLISCLELATRYQVSYDTITRDISALSRFAPISSKLGRYGGIYIVDGYVKERAYLTRKEEMLLKELMQKVSEREQKLLQMVLYKFAMPQA